MKRSCLDYSSPNNWIQESLKLENVDIKQAWSNWKVDAEVFFNDTKMFSAEICDFHSLASSSHISFLKPCGNKIGLNPIEVDWSINDTDDNQIQPTIDDESISDYVNQPGKEKVTINIHLIAKLMYKACH